MDLRSRSGEAAGAPFSIYSERDLHDLWERQRFRREGLLTEDAIPLSVEFPGYRWGEGGPDFRGARLLFAGQRRWGDVELHLSPSGWAAHGHRRDEAYASALERALRESAAALPRALWRLRNVRPANHPSRRLAGMARFLAGSRAEGLARGLAMRPGLPDMTAWLAHEGIGEGRAREIAIN